jgi:hypothetical protein
VDWHTASRELGYSDDVKEALMAPDLEDLRSSICAADLVIILVAEMWNEFVEMDEKC